MILETARELDAVVVTLDTDFHSLLVVGHLALPSVIRIRMEGLKGPELARLVSNVAAAIETDLFAGSAVSVTASAVRLRRLPLV